MGASASGHRHAVLLVEEDDDLRHAFVERARNSGLDPITFSDGRDALDYLRRGPRPCLILLDPQMPGLDGLAFRREQLRHPTLAHIPTAVVSRPGFPGEADARALGLTVFLDRPIDPAQLLPLFVD